MGLRPAVAFAFALVVLACGGCMSKRESVALRTGGDVTPIVEVKPGYEARIALMDRYRLHDEMRKHMMVRPRVWVEEVSIEDLPPEARALVEEAPPPEPAGDAAAHGCGFGGGRPLCLRAAPAP